MNDSYFSFSRQSYFIQFLLLIFLIGLFIAISGIISAVLLNYKLGISDPGTIPEYLLNNPEAVNIIKLIQIFISIFTFIIPALCFTLLINENPLTYFGINKRPYIILVLLIPFIIIFVAPFVQFLFEYNKLIVLPPFLSSLEKWIQEQEASLELLLKSFLIMESVNDLLINMILISIIPAIGEELLFRGTIQTLLIRWTKRPLVGIVLSAILFSTLHFQFYGFIPRMALGILFGYLFLWSGNLWVPVIAHFLHNGAQVLLLYLYKSDISNFDVENMGGFDWQITVICTLTVILFLYAFKKTAIMKKVTGG